MWIRFAFPEDLLAILDKLFEGGFNATIVTQRELVDSVFSVLGSSVPTPAMMLALNDRLVPLSKFCLSEKVTSVAAQSVFAELLKRSLPLGYDGYLAKNDLSLSQVLAEAEDCWVRRLKSPAPGIRIETFLSMNTWTQIHVDIITPLLYRSRAVHTALASWLWRGMAKGLGVDLLLPLLHAFLDSCPSEYVVQSQTWDRFFSQFLDLIWKQHESCAEAIRSVILILQFSEDRPHFVTLLNKRLEKSQIESFSCGALTLASKLQRLFREDLCGYVGATIDHAMRWTVHRLSDGFKVPESDSILFGKLGRLLSFMFISLTQRQYT